MVLNASESHSAFSLFFMGSPSFLAHQRALAQGQGRSNCQTLFGISAIPSDNYIRLMLVGAPTAAFAPLFIKAIETPDVLTPFRRLGGRTLIALDGTDHHCSRKVHCARCSSRKRSDGGAEYFHAFLGASIVAPAHAYVLPLAPEFIAPHDGEEKQDCERNAAKRWLARHGASLGRLRPVFLGDDLFACQPIAEAMRAAGGCFILTPAFAGAGSANRPRIRPSPNIFMAPSWRSIARRSSNAPSAPPRFTAGSRTCRCATAPTRCG